MTNILRSAIFMALGLLLACGEGEKNIPNSPAPRDESAIQQLLDAESAAFYARDHARWSSYFEHSDSLRWACVEQGDVLLEALSWSQLDTFVGNYMKANPDPLPVELYRDSYQFSFDAQSVLVTYDEYFILDSHSELRRQTRVLAYGPEGWKIRYLNSYFVGLREPQAY